jgi:hypothetical protein
VLDEVAVFTGVLSQRQVIDVMLDGVIPSETGSRFVRGDTDANGALEITDPIGNLNYQFLGEFAPPCLDALDFDDNGAIELTDPIGNLTYQFLSGPPPVTPFPDCGEDTTDDALSCDAYAACP